MRGADRARSFAAIAEYAHDTGRTILDKLSVGAVVPHASTIRRVLQDLDPDAVEAAMRSWAMAQLADQPPPDGVPAREQRQVLALDGKTVRSARISSETDTGASGYRQPHLVSVLDQSSGVVLGQVAVEAKNSEVAAFTTLLDNLDLTDVLITADAAHTNRNHAGYLHERGGHYLLTAKRNQPTLLRRLRALPWKQIRSQVRTGNAPQIMAALRNLVITALRLAGYVNIAAALRHHARDTSRPLATYKIT